MIADKGGIRRYRVVRRHLSLFNILRLVDGRSVLASCVSGFKVSATLLAGALVALGLGAAALKAWSAGNAWPEGALQAFIAGMAIPVAIFLITRPRALSIREGRASGRIVASVRRAGDALAVFDDAGAETGRIVVDSFPGEGFTRFKVLDSSGRAVAELDAASGRLLVEGDKEPSRLSPRALDMPRELDLEADRLIVALVFARRTGFVQRLAAPRGRIKIEGERQ